MVQEPIPASWQLFYFRPFKAALDELEQAVTKLARQDPAGYNAHPRTRLLASVYKVITQLVPANPDHPDFRLGKTLGAEYANWRRVKKGMPYPYRPFFPLRFQPGQTHRLRLVQRREQLAQGRLEDR